jgi:hypothetical protein
MVVLPLHDAVQHLLAIVTNHHHVPQNIPVNLLRIIL